MTAWSTVVTVAGPTTTTYSPVASQTATIMVTDRGCAARTPPATINSIRRSVSTPTTIGTPRRVHDDPVGIALSDPKGVALSDRKRSRIDGVDEARRPGIGGSDVADVRTPFHTFKSSSPSSTKTHNHRIPFDLNAHNRMPTTPGDHRRCETDHDDGQ